MLQELSVVEQRYLAVREVLEGAKVTDVATRYRVDRRTVHRWLVRYASEGLGALTPHDGFDSVTEEPSS
jgi:transposase